MLISVQVKPGSRTAPLVETLPDGSLLVHVRELAEAGAANQALVKALAKQFGVSRRAIKIKSGHSARIKRKVIE